MALAYTNIQVEIREISLRDRPDELYKASKKGTVPVLITINNEIIDESLDIMLWALKNNTEQIWLREEHSNDTKIINHIDTHFKKWLDRYKYHDRYPENSKEYYRDNCSKILSEYENQLCTTKYLLRDKMGIVDVAIFPFIRQFANVDYNWFSSNFDNLTSWLEEISSSDLFNKIMKKYEIWDSDSITVTIND